MSSLVSDEEIDGMLDWYDQALANGQGFKSEEEREAYFEEIGDPLKHPFWAQSTEDLEGNPMVEAFRALREEDKTQVELAVMYKDEGNEWIKKKTKKEQQDAINCYSHALTFLDKADAARKDGTEEEADKTVDLRKLRSQIMNNRALACMNLKNFGMALRDINTALLLWNQNIKAHYRKVKCLLQVRRPEAALKAVEEGLSVAGDETTELLALKTQCEKELSRLARLREEANAARLAMERKWSEAWAIATRNGVSLGPAEPSWVPPPQLVQHMPFVDEEDGKVDSWPTVVLYPQHSQLDVIQGANADTMLVMLLAEMFPELEDCGSAPVVPWDSKNEYHVSNLVAYIQINTTSKFSTEDQWMEYNRARVANQNGETKMLDDGSGTEASRSIAQLNTKSPDDIKLVEVHMGCTFRQILTAKDFVLQGGVMTLTVFPKSSQARKDYLRLFKSYKVGTLQPTGQIVF